MGEVVQVKSLSFWHEQIVDWMLINPHLHLYDCAKYFNVSPSWLSIVINSDMFKVYKDKRYAAHHERVSEVVLERVRDLADTSLEVLTSRIKQNRDTVSLDTVQRAAELGLRSFGIAAAHKRGTLGEGPGVVVNINGVTPEQLAAARERMRTIGGRGAVHVEDAQPVQVEAEVLPPPEPYVALEDRPRPEGAPATVVDRASIGDTQLELPLGPPDGLARFAP